ncbi:MAG: class I SAM-dependent methyltransferase [Gaiellaceae bacterium]
MNSERVTVQRADAQDLPFEDAGFDLVLCLFGIMFFPDKVRANTEAAASFALAATTSS